MNLRKIIYFPQRIRKLRERKRLIQERMSSLGYEKPSKYSSTAYLDFYKKFSEEVGKMTSDAFSLYSSFRNAFDYHYGGIKGLREASRISESCRQSGVDSLEFMKEASHLLFNEANRKSRRSLRLLVKAFKEKGEKGIYELSRIGYLDAIGVLGERHPFVNSSSLPVASAMRFLRNNRGRPSRSELLDARLIDRFKRFERVFAGGDPLELKPEDFVAVHLTSFLPDDKGVMHPLGDNLPDYPRRSIHFCLNGPVGSHMFGDWDKHKIAVLIPAHLIKGWFADINGVDSYGFGRLKLPKGTVILVEKKLAEEKKIKDGQSLGNAVIQVVDEEEYSKKPAPWNFLSGKIYPYLTPFRKAVVHKISEMGYPPASIENFDYHAPSYNFISTNIAEAFYQNSFGRRTKIPVTQRGTHQGVEEGSVNPLTFKEVVDQLRFRKELLPPSWYGKREPTPEERSKYAHLFPYWTKVLSAVEEAREILSLDSDVGKRRQILERTLKHVEEVRPRRYGAGFDLRHIASLRQQLAFHRRSVYWARILIKLVNRLSK